MAKGFRASVCTPDLLRPDTDRWLARMFDRLMQVGHDDRATDGARRCCWPACWYWRFGARMLISGARYAQLCRRKGLQAGAALGRLANQVDCTALQHDPIIALSLLIGSRELKFCPSPRGRNTSQ